jgi:hypothetical protein
MVRWSICEVPVWPRIARTLFCASIHWTSALMRCSMRLFPMTCSLLLATLFAHADDSTAKQLDDIGRVATVMVDGDLCRRIVKPRALHYLANPDPKDQWAAGDNYEVDHAAFIQMKKTLRRLALLASFPCDVNLWMPLEQQPGKIHIVTRNVNEMSQFWQWGALFQDMDPRMKAVLDSGKRVTVSDKPGWISVLAPVYDSEGSVVALVEAVTNARPDPHENVK